MLNNKASAILRDRLQKQYGFNVPGCVFYVTRNGEPFADGSFGWARMLNSPGLPASMSPDTLVHIASISKFFCAVAILKLIQEWNWILSNSAANRPGHPVFLKPSLVDDHPLIKTARQYGSPIDLDTKVYPLITPLLDSQLIASYSSPYPGANVQEITLRQLLTHTSAMNNDYDVADLGGLKKEEVQSEPVDDGPTTYNLSKIATALLKQEAEYQWGYNNEAYTILGGVIEAVTKTSYASWLRKHLFPEPRFDDIARKAIHPIRAARYYRRQGLEFEFGNSHPDYTNFSASGGWYVSARAFCEWVDAVMQKTPIGGAPVLDNPHILLTEMLGLEAYSLGRFRGATKNGGATPGGKGSTNCRFAFLRGYGSERVCAFALANVNIDANPILDVGLLALREQLGRRPGPIPTPPTTAATGLLQVVYWDDAGTLKSASKVAAVVIKKVDIGGVNVNRTNLLGNNALAGGKTPSDLVMAEWRGMLRVTDSGTYRFRLSSDDGSLLWLDDELVVDNDGDHPLGSIESDGISLSSGGSYPMRIRWYNGQGGGSLYLEWQTPTSASYEPVPIANFTPAG